MIIDKHIAFLQMSWIEDKTTDEVIEWWEREKVKRERWGRVRCFDILAYS